LDFFSTSSDAMPTVFAHTQFAGANDFWNGALHPLYTPAHVALMVALGLYLGQRASQQKATSVLAFGLLSGVGLVWAVARPTTDVGQVAPLALAMLVAILIALDRAIPEFASVAVCGAGGLLIGADSGVAHASLEAVLEMSVGTWLSVAFVVFNIAFYTAGLTRHWQRVGVRVAASWILAVSMLVLAFAIRR
jgi:hydrogenase/urease accessory protein HupE